MAMQQHLETLKKRHSQLKERIQADEAHFACDDATLHYYKREKLRLKDEIARLSGGYREAA